MSDLQFAELCSNGYLELAQKCYQNDPNLNIYYNGTQAFTGACSHNHMEIAKWFITILPADADYITYFNRALSYGRLELMLFIIDFMPDFDVSDDQHNIFYMARSRKYYHIIEWLHSIKPEVYSFDDQGVPHCNNEKYKIRETERETEETWSDILPILVYGGEIIVFIFIIVFWIV
jgi:hypothetical protein